MAKTTDNTAEAADLVTVTLKVDNHEHQGEIIAKGGSIQVDQETAQWMRDQNLIGD